MAATIDARTRLLRAWKTFDRVANTLGDQRRKVTQFTLKQEADVLTDATRDYAAEVGISPRALTDVLQAWRRAGLSQAQALDAVDAGLAAR